jgi:aminomethyltransferase
MTMSEVAPRNLKRTALYEEHRALGGRLIAFAGFDMPVQYAGILKEHEAVRKRAGMFDLSHMAQFELHGADVGAWADSLTVNNVATMKPGQARYNIFTNEQGGCHDDVLFYRLGDREWLLVVNASNAEKMWAHLSERRTPDVRLVNRHADRALIAVQGPRAIDIVSALLVGEEERAGVRAMTYYTCRQGVISGRRALLARTGYTGEDGFELFVDACDASSLWRRFMDVGASHGLEPAGLGSRDILRLEAGMPLYGHELTEELSPIAGGQRWAVKMNKPEFVGKRALAEQLESDSYERIVGLVVPGRIPARTGYPVFHGEEPAGEVRSASLSPSLQANIATALVRKKASLAGTELTIEIRGMRHPAHVVELPFYTALSRRP